MVGKLPLAYLYLGWVYLGILTDVGVVKLGFSTIPHS